MPRNVKLRATSGRGRKTVGDRAQLQRATDPSIELTVVQRAGRLALYERSTHDVEELRFRETIGPRSSEVERRSLAHRASAKLKKWKQ